MNLPRRPRVLAALATLFCIRVVLGANALDPATGDLPSLKELFWALFLLFALVLAGVLWAGVIRRTGRRQLESIRQREAALEEHYRELFENAHDIIFTLDMDGHLTSLNKAGEERLGFHREDLTRLNLMELVPAHQQTALREMLGQFASGLVTCQSELELRGLSGRSVFLRANLRRQALAGKPTQIQGIAWDITARRQAEDSLRESEQRLRRSLEERVRIGRDLHDGIIQSIYAIGLSISDCRREMEENPTAADGRLARAVTDLNMVIRDVRNFILGLEPEALKGREFRTALEAVGVTMSGTQGAQFSLDVSPEAAERLTAVQATHLLQIAREAMSNSLRHGRARRILVGLKERDQRVCLEIDDDGTGFDRSMLTRAGHGLKNIEARAKELGAACEITSQPGRGTRVSIELYESQENESV